MIARGQNYTLTDFSAEECQELAARAAVLLAAINEPDGWTPVA